MNTPYLEISLAAIRRNATRLKERCHAHGVEITFVTKGFCAAVPIIQAVQACGVTRFADSRMKDIIKVKQALPGIHYTLIRVPMLSEVEAVVEWADCSLQSQIEVIRAVSAEALRRGKIHPIILMIDVGDLREGVFGEEQLLEIAAGIKDCAGVELVGVATNVGCYGGVLPTVQNTQLLVHYRDILNTRCGFAVKTVSGGATNTTLLMDEGTLPEGINSLRIGEAILFGQDTNNGRMLERLDTDAFTFYAEVAELRRKPSKPIGVQGVDCCGCTVSYEDRGTRWRAICSAGKQDVSLTALTPLLPGAVLLGASSDHLIMDVEDCINEVQVGTVMAFRCGYMAVLSATISGYVGLVFRD